MVELGGTTNDPSTLTQTVENQALTYAFQLHHMPEKRGFWVVDGYRGRAKWHGWTILGHQEL